MPTIRLADIPNALGTPAFATGEGISTASIIRGSQSMLDQTLESAPYTAQARAAAKLGKAASELASGFADSFSKAKDTADLARADTIMRSAWEKQQNDQLELAPEEWGKTWSRNLGESKKQIDSLGLSESASRQFFTSWQKWSQTSKIQIDGQALKKQIDIMESDIALNFNKRLAQDDIEGAMVMLDEAKKKRAIRPEVANALESQAQDNIFRKAKSEMAAGVMLKIQNDPVGAAREFEKIRRGEKSETFAEVTETADIVRFNDVADAEKNRFQRQFDEDALDLILTGQLRSEQEVRDFVSDQLPEQRVLGLLGALQEVPAERERRLAMRPMLYAMADAYDPANDDEQGTEYFRIRDSIMQLPSDQREEPLAMLRKAKNQDPGESTPLKVAVGQMKEMFEAGKFGSWEVGEDKKPLNDGEWAKYTEAGKRFAGYKSSLENWARSNPKEAADQNAVYEQFNRLITYERQLQKFQQESTRFRWPWESSAPAAPPPPPITPADVRQKLDAIKPKSSLGPDATRREIEDEAQRIDFETPLPDLMPS